MEGGVTGLPGLTVLRPVARDLRAGVEHVIVLLLRLEERTVLVIARSLRTVKSEIVKEVSSRVT